MVELKQNVGFFDVADVKLSTLASSQTASGGVYQDLGEVTTPPSIYEVRKLFLYVRNVKDIYPIAIILSNKSAEPNDSVVSG